jgi:Pyruvate/2-oxoacid:ferredoxin oxidoreductase gamma subunit
MNYNRELLITGPRVYKILEISQIISQASILQGLEVKTAEFTNESLMCIENAHIRIGKNKYSPLVLKNNVDVLVCFEPLLALDLAIDYLSSEGIVIINTHSILPFIHLFDQAMSLFEQLTDKIIKLDILQIAKNAEVINKNNFVMLGAICGLNVTPINPLNIIEAIEQILNPDDIKLCIKAIEIGKQAASALLRTHTQL